MQMKAIDIWQFNGFKSKAAALRAAGYGKSIIDQPHKVFDSPTIIHELEFRGLDRWGRRNKPQAIEVNLPAMDPQQLAVERLIRDEGALQELREKLGYVPRSK